MKYKTRIEITPGWHRCHQDPKQNYGICDPRVFFYMECKYGVVVWSVFSDWGMPREEFDKLKCNSPMHQEGYPRYKPSGGPVEFHWRHRQHSFLMAEKCELVGTCYFDQGFSIGNEMFDILRTKGSDAVFAEMYKRMADSYQPSRWYHRLWHMLTHELEEQNAS